MGSSGSLKAAVWPQKALQWSKTRENCNIGRTEENGVFLTRGHWFAVRNKWMTFYYKKETEKSEWVARPGTFSFDTGGFQHQIWHCGADVAAASSAWSHVEVLSWAVAQSLLIKTQIFRLLRVSYESSKLQKLFTVEQTCCDPWWQVACKCPLGSGCTH